MTVTIELAPELEAALQAMAGDAGISVGEYITSVVRERIESADQNRPSDALLRLDLLQSRVPVEEWSKLPVDLAQNLDRYLYGHDKGSA